ncbi:MAG TPA: SpoIID/LytB domain-containing protein [Gemmatimonadales bacterium]
MKSSFSSATTAADRFRAVALAVFLLAACVPAAEGPGDVAPVAGAGPPVRVLLADRAAGLDVGGGHALAITDRDGGALGIIPAGTTARLTAVGGDLSIQVGRTRVSAPFEVEIAAIPPATVRLGGMEYRGLVRIAATTTGIQVVNVLGLEEYLGGVVGAELGRRSPEEREAVAAQAILSRTVAYRSLERRRLQAWDLMATVADQVYRGVAAETPEGTAAAAATRGMLVVWAGQPIDAFFHSTCGGRTATPEEVFVSAARPYLQSIRDVRGDGIAWCAASPRFRWREAWPAERLLAILRETLPSQGADPARLTTLRDLGVTSRTPSGRVQAVRFDLGGQAVPVSGPAIRQVLRTVEGQPLRSTAFDLIAVKSAGGITVVEVEGRGAGHGVGFCQWGAIGRARDGWDYRRILAAYFPGTELQRRW